MSNMIGDNLQSEIHRGGCSNIEWQITRSGTPTYETLLPSSVNGGFVEEEIGPVGLDGKVDIQYYKQTLAIRFLQTDNDTMSDLYATALTAILHTTGISTKITLNTGKVITVTMRFRRTFRAEGYSSVAGVDLIGVAVSATSVFA